MTIRSRLPAALTCIASLTLLASSTALAAEKKAKADSAAQAPKEKKSVALGPITGTKPKEVREWVRVVLDEEFELTDAEDFKAKNDAGYAKMGKDLAVDFILIGKLDQERLVLSVRSGKDGKLVRDVEIKATRGPKLKKAIATELAPSIAAAVGQKSEAPSPAKATKKKPVDEDLAEEEEEEEEEEAEQEEQTGEDAGTEKDSGEEKAEEPEAESEPAGPLGPTAEPLIATAGVRFYRRTFTFKDTLVSRGIPIENLRRPLRDYELPLGPAIFIRAQFYPGVFLGAEGFVTNVGLIAGFEKGIATSSTYTGADPTIPDELRNDLQEWHVGLRARIPMATTEFGFVGAYGQHRYQLKGDEMLPTVPDVSYSYVKLAADARLSFGKFSAGGHLGARLVLGMGDLDEDYWFPNASGTALDAGLAFGYRIIDPISIVAGVDFVRYGLDFNPIDPSAIAVAGGATDQYLSGWIGAQFQLPGRGGVSASASTE